MASCGSIAQLWFGEQTGCDGDGTRSWLALQGARISRTGLLLRRWRGARRRWRWSRRVPSMVYRAEKRSRRVREMFPGARFIHLVRHPIGHGQSVLKYMKERAKYGAMAPTHWLQHLAAFPYRFDDETDTQPAGSHPQRGWYALNTNICRFLADVPSEAWTRVRGEDLVGEPDEYMSRLAEVARVAPRSPGHRRDEASRAFAVCMLRTSWRPVRKRSPVSRQPGAPPRTGRRAAAGRAAIVAAWQVTQSGRERHRSELRVYIMRKVQSPPWRINEPRGRAGLRLRGIEGRADRSRAHLVQGDKAGSFLRSDFHPRSPALVLVARMRDDRPAPAAIRAPRASVVQCRHGPGVAQPLSV